MSDACFICTDGAPLVTLCESGHQCCQPCLTRWLGQFHRTCPYCRQGLLESALPVLKYDYRRIKGHVMALGAHTGLVACEYVTAEIPAISLVFCVILILITLALTGGLLHGLLPEQQREPRVVFLWLCIIYIRLLMMRREYWMLIAAFTLVFNTAVFVHEERRGAFVALS